MPVLLLTEDDVRQLLTMDMALEAVEAGLRKLALDEAQNIPRSRCQTDHAMLHVMAAAAKTLGVDGLQGLRHQPQGAQFHVGLFDGKTGALLALMQADYLGQVRTGAASGVATQYMARPDASEVGLFGSGKQARTQLIAVCKVRKISRVQVYSPNEDHRRQFAEEMSDRLRRRGRAGAAAGDGRRGQGHRHHRHEQPRAGASTATGSPRGRTSTPSAPTSSARPRSTPWRCGAANRSWWTARTRRGWRPATSSQALEEGSIHWADVHELGQVIVGRYTGRAHPQDVTLFKSLGIAIEDVAVAAKVYAKAQAAGIGKTVEW